MNIPLVTIVSSFSARIVSMGYEYTRKSSSSKILRYPNLTGPGTMESPVVMSIKIGVNPSF